MAPKPPMDSREALKPISYILNNISGKFQLIRRNLNFPAFFQFPWQRPPFWKFLNSKFLLHFIYNLSVKFHPIWSTFNFSRHFCFFWFPWQRRPFWKFLTPKYILGLTYNLSIKFLPIWSTFYFSRLFFQWPWKLTSRSLSRSMVMDVKTENLLSLCLILSKI